MYDLCSTTDALNVDALIGYAEQLELDVERFARDLRKGVGGPRVADDVDGADLSGVSGIPSFFINGRRHYGAYDIDTLPQAVRAAGARAMFAQT
jgi:predicted DsbA family dithiol-disulfide isomerase